MNLFIKKTEEKKEWEEFIHSRNEANFLQSYNWGKFQSQLNKKVFYLFLCEGENEEIAEKIGAVLAIKEVAKRGSYLTIAGGPIIDWESKNVENNFNFLTAELKKLAKSEDCSFVRMRPQVKESSEIVDFVEKNGWVKSPMHVTADLTLQLDLSQTEEELLMQMRKNTRYEVRQAGKRGIIVEQKKDPAEIKEFFDHQLILAEKHGFVPFSFDFLHEQFKAFVEDDQVALFHSFLPGEGGVKKLLASAFIIFYNSEAVYHYGISTPENDRQPGSYACQWAAILEAKKRGCRFYNFWGIAPKEDRGHRFAGVSTFKRGFGGQEVQYLSAHDLPVSWQYNLVKTFETVRKKARKL